MKRLGGGETAPRLARDCPAEHLLELPRYIAAILLQRREHASRLLGQHYLWRNPLERGPTEQAVIGDSGQGVEVSALVHALAQQLLGGGELRRAAAGRRAAEALAPERQGETEVGDAETAVRLDEHVLGLEVAVHQAERVGVLEGGERFVEESSDAVHRQRALLRHQLGHAQPRHELHCVPLQPGAAGNVIDADDVGVPEAGRELRLPPEALHHGWGGGE